MKTLISSALAAPPGAWAEAFNPSIPSNRPSSPRVGQPNTPFVAQTIQRREARGSDGRNAWTVAYGGAPHGFENTLEAVSDGLTDMGWVGLSPSAVKGAPSRAETPCRARSSSAPSPFVVTISLATPILFNLPTLNLVFQ